MVLSHSKIDIFKKCKRWYYYVYEKKIPVIADDKALRRGSVFHKIAQYIVEKKLEFSDLEKIKEEFNTQWHEFKLDEDFGQKKDETWLMVLNFLKEKPNLTSTELKILKFDPPFISYIDGVNSDEGLIIDYKTGGYFKDNEGYNDQLGKYALMYYKQFNKLAKSCELWYVKYSPIRKIKSSFNEEDLKKIEEEIHTIDEFLKTHKKQDEYTKCLDNGKECDIFCPFKNLCIYNSDTLKYTVVLLNNYLFIDGFITPLLNKQLNKKFSYELKNSFFIKKHNPNINTTIRFWSEHKKLLPIGFKDAVLKTLKDYGDYLRKHENKTVVIDIDDKRIFNEDKIQMPEKFINGIILRDYQNEAVDIFLKYKIGGLQLVTGSGKTEVAIEIIRQLGYKTLFVTERKELLFQTKERIEKALGIKVGIIGSGEKIIEHVTIATIQTLSKNIAEFKDYLKSVRFVIFDEAHHCPAKSYIRLGNYLPNTEFRLLLSGTMTRDDGNEMMIFAIGGNIIHNITANELIEKGYLIQPQIVFIKDFLDDYNISQLERDSQTGLVNETANYNLYYENFIMKSNKRNEIISKLCNKYKNKKILILTRLIEHGEILKQLIPQSEHLWGNTEKEIRKDIMEQFIKGDLNILISTVSIWSEGIDFPNLNILINASANSGDVKTIQMLGRILRILKNKKDAIYYDFLDESKFFKRASFKRRRALIKQGHNVEIIKSQSI